MDPNPPLFGGPAPLWVAAACESPLLSIAADAHPAFRR